MHFEIFDLFCLTELDLFHSTSVKLKVISSRIFYHSYVYSELQLLLFVTFECFKAHVEDLSVSFKRRNNWAEVTS